MIGEQDWKATGENESQLHMCYETLIIIIQNDKYPQACDADMSKQSGLVGT